MKVFLKTLVCISMLMGSFSIAHAKNEGADVGQLIVKLNRSNADIDALESQLSRAKSSRSKALWVGIPVTIISTAASLFIGFAGMMSDSPSAGEEVSKTARKFFGFSALTAAGTTYFVHIKNDEIDLLRSRLADAKKKNQETLVALEALKD